MDERVKVKATVVTVSEHDRKILAALPDSSIYGPDSRFRKYGEEKRSAAWRVLKWLQQNGNTKTTNTDALNILRELYPDIQFVAREGVATKTVKHNGAAGPAANGRIIRGTNSLGG